MSLVAHAAVLSRQAVRDLDAATIAAGTPSRVLMERAGAALADFLCDGAACAVEAVATTERPRLLVLAGCGNNGGDGFVVARLLASRRWRTTVALVGGPPRAGSDAAYYLEEWKRIGGETVGIERALHLLSGGAADFDLALDSIFGTGLDRPATGAAANLIDCLNASGLPTVATDIPSGLCADRGVPLGVAVRARSTLALGAAKPGLFLAEGPSYCGRTRIADIGLLAPAEAGAGIAGETLTPATMAGVVPRLDPRAHKGNRGHVLVVAGSRGKSGAAVLAARAALRAGAGLVTVACPASVQSVVAGALAETMTVGLEDEGTGEVAESGAARLPELVEAATAVVVGPGLGTGPGAEAAVRVCLERAGRLVVDADALNVLAGLGGKARGHLVEARRRAGFAPAILTPHPGEMARLTGTSTTEVQATRDTVCRTLAGELGAVVVLKGAATVVSDGSRVAFNTTGGPALGSAGMGDVLAGACAALAARLEDPWRAACVAVFAHGQAGDELAAAIGDGPGIVASEVADRLPLVLARLQPR